MKCIYVNPDDSIAYIGDRYDAESAPQGIRLLRLATGVREVPLESIKLARSDLPGGINTNNLNQLAGLGYYCYVEQDRYVFQLDKEDE